MENVNDGNGKADLTSKKIMALSEDNSSVSTQRKGDAGVKEHESKALASPTPEKKIHPPRSRKYNTAQSRSEQGPSVIIRPENDGQKGVLSDDAKMPRVEESFSFSSEPLKEKTSKLSEKHKTLVEIFEQMVVSFRLLCLKKRLTSFHNISMQVEVLAKKKFSLDCLAQMKYLLPEAIKIEKTLIFDELSHCMKPDIKLSLKLDAIKNVWKLQQASYPDLSRAFRVRLLDFLNSHSKDVDIPKAPIFDSCGGQINLPKSPNQLHTALPIEVGQAQSNPPSHLPTSFKLYFSKKVNDPDEQMAEACSVSNVQENSLPKSGGDGEGKGVVTNVGTPVKVNSSPVKLMTETPAQSTPRRPVGKISSQSARRVLYAPAESSEENNASRFGRRQQVLASLPGTVDTISIIVGTSSSAVITKQELVHKILSYNCDVEDPCEAEEQLSLLEELVPDWIRCKATSTGDSLYCISRASDPKAVLSKLVENPC